MLKPFHDQTNLRLEVQTTPAGLPNLVLNPGGEKGSWFWVTPVANTSIAKSSPTSDLLAFTTTVAQACYFTTELMPVAASQYVAARLTVAVMSQMTNFKVTFDWFKADRTANGSSAQSAALTGWGGSGVVNYVPAQQAPANTAYVKMRVDCYGTAPGGTPFANAALTFKDAMVAFSGTSGPLASGFAYSDPYAWTNILGPTFSIGIKRSALNVGTLTAGIADATLDPTVAADIRPGRQVRVRTLTTNGWTSVYEGKISTAKVDYDRLKRPGASVQPIITLTALDNIAVLANRGEARGVAAIADLPYLLEDKGTPWNVNGSGSQIPTSPTIVSLNDNASVLNQCAITRDSALGYAWVDRLGVMNVWDAASLGNTVACTFTDVATAGSGYETYSACAVDFDTERCINEVDIKFLRYDPASGETEEVSYGPYVDQTSIDTWGPYSDEFTIHGGLETSARFSSYAAQILAANATPAIRANSLRMPVLDQRSLDHATLLDLYSLVHVTYDTKVNDDYRITDLEHSITPEKWIVDYAFGHDGAVAAPTWTPAPDGKQAVGLPWRDVYRATDQTLATSTFVVVAFDTNRTPAVSMAYAGGTFTADRPGVYDINGVVTFAGAATPVGRRIARVLVNGVAIFRNDFDVVTGTGTIGVPFACKARLSTGDAVTVEAWHNQGANLNVLGSTNQTVATVAYLRP